MILVYIEVHTKSELKTIPKKKKKKIVIILDISI